MVKKVRIIIYALISIALIIFIFSNSLQPRDESNARSLGITTFLKPLLDPTGRLSEETFNHYVRKAAHFSEFAALGFCLLGFFDSILKKKPYRLVFSAITSLFVASSDEIIQIFIEGRGPSVKDVLLDFSGSIFGIAMMLLLHWLICTIKKRRKDSTQDTLQK